MAILFGGFGAAGSLLQRRLGLPDASVQVLQGFAFVLILASEALRGVDWAAVASSAGRRASRRPSRRPAGRQRPARHGAHRMQLSDVLLPFLAAIVGGALRVGMPFLFVSLGECLTEKSGRINLGLEGVLVLLGDGRVRRRVPERLAVDRRAGRRLRAAPRSRCCTACCARCRASTTSPPASR